MHVVELFLKAFFKKGHYETYPMDGVMHHLTAEGTFTSCSLFSQEYKEGSFVRVLPCDIEYAWKVLKEKGYHVLKDGSLYCLHKVKYEGIVGYYLF